MVLGFGITALILTVLAIFAPGGINLILVAIAVTLSIVAALFGDRAFSIITSILSYVNILLLSPATLFSLSMMEGKTQEHGWTGPLIFVLIGIALPIVAVGLNASNVLKLNKTT